MRHLLVLLVAVASFATAPPAAAGTARTGACGLLERPADREFAIPGMDVRARDPYGGVYSTVQGFRFDVVGEVDALARVAAVQWALDGVPKRNDDRGPVFEWVNYASVGFTPGEHTVRVTVTPKTGAPAAVEFMITATACSYADFEYTPPPRAGRGTTELVWDSAVDSDRGVALDAVKARAVRNVKVELPDRLRDRTVGTLTIERPGQRALKYSLRLPRTGTVLLHRDGVRVVIRPRSREFLRISGLPGGAQRVRFVLRRHGTRLVHAADPCRMALVRGEMRAGDATAGETHGGHYAC